MAKKVVASLQKAERKNFAQVIISARSPKTGAYTFKEKILPLDEAKQMMTASAN